MKNKLKVLCAEFGWSQEELGNQVGILRYGNNAIERGKFDPSLPLAFKLAYLFNMKIEEIFFRMESVGITPTVYSNNRV